jgi:hypothetical protein
MAIFLTIIWFLCGIGGLHLAFVLAGPDDTTFRPAYVWYAVLGPLPLIAVILLCVLDAVEDRKS